jgi:hypothetical protein
MNPLSSAPAGGLARTGGTERLTEVCTRERFGSRVENTSRRRLAPRPQRCPVIHRTKPAMQAPITGGTVRNNESAYCGR